MALLFCNIAWMNNYEGRDKNDPPLGGGNYVDENGEAGEECNFVHCDDGYCYGYFETSGKRIKIERLGADKSAEFVDDVDIIWSAPHRGGSPRTIVGWYLNARLYRHRQSFKKFPSKAHTKANASSFLVRAGKENCVLLSTDERKLKLGHGRGWLGQRSWWYADKNTNPEAQKFVNQVKKKIRSSGAIETTSHVSNMSNDKSKSGRKVGKAPSKAYVKYLEEHEINISPQHDKLEKLFKEYIRRTYTDATFPNECVQDDLRIRSMELGDVMAELKPADQSNVRYAIRTAMGQLLDYKQRQNWKGKQLIVVGADSLKRDDKKLALENGFGLARKDNNGGFEIFWP